MDARPLLGRIASALDAARLEAILVGNAAAALQGAPVTTVDFDFMFRKTSRNLARLRALARSLDAVILKPYYPASDLFRVTNDGLGLQADFMAALDGIRSYEALRARALAITVDRSRLLVADLGDVIRSKRAANRPRDRAILPVLEATLREKARKR